MLGAFERQRLPRAEATVPCRRRREDACAHGIQSGRKICLQAVADSAVHATRSRALMKTLPVMDRPNWLSSAAWPWPTYALDHDTGRIAVTDIGQGPALLFVHVGSWSFVWRDVIMHLSN